MPAVLPMYAVGMNSAGVGLRVLALCSTVALGGGYVWWSQKKAEERRAKEVSREAQVLPGSKSAIFSGERIEFSDEYAGKGVEVPAASGPGWNDIGLKGEEKKDPRTNADFIQETPANDEPRAMLPGSKSSALSAVGRQSIEDILTPSETDKEKEPQKRTVLPGSKSIDRLLPPPDLEEKSEP